MKNKYRIYPEYNFGFAKAAPGTHSFDSLYDFAKQVRDDENFHLVYYMLSDLREVKFDFELNQLHKMIKLVYEYSRKDNQKMGIYLLSEPMATVYTKIFFNALKRTRDYCFTIEKAYSLLNMPISLDKFLQLTEI